MTRHSTLKRLTLHFLHASTPLTPSRSNRDLPLDSEQAHHALLHAPTPEQTKTSST
ncbi:hypothetical protein YC2023_102540 [Brassica napus]